MRRIATDDLDDELQRAWQANQSRLLVLLARLTSWEDAPDLLQETFLRVYQAQPKDFAEQLPAGYLVRAAKTTAFDHLQRQHATNVATVEYLEHVKNATAPPSAERRVLLREVHYATLQLSPRDQALLRTYVESPSIAARARELGIPATTLASRYYAVFRRLRKFLR